MVEVLLSALISIRMLMSRTRTSPFYGPIISSTIVLVVMAVEVRTAVELAGFHAFVFSEKN